MQVLPKNFKPVSRVVSDDQSVLCFLKWDDHPENRFAPDGTTPVTAATCDVQANLLDFQVNAAGDGVIGTYTSNTGTDDQVVYADAATIQGLLDRINSTEIGVTRYRAGLGDFRPQFTIGTGDAIADTTPNILLGRHHDGLAVLADSSALATANLFAAALGTGRTRMGRGPAIPDHFQSDYTSTVGGVVTRVRSARRVEDFPAQANFQVYLTRVVWAAAYASNAKTINVFDDAGNTLFSEVMGSADVLDAAAGYNIDNPIAVAPPGSPIFVEGTGSSTLTDGNLSISGYIRIG